MHARFTLVVVLALSGCIESPNVELVDAPDASASSSPAPAPEPSSSSTSSTPDAAPPAPACDQAACASAGGTCTNDECTISCTSQSRCEGVKCPSGMPCSVSCIGKDACTKTIECRTATKCTIACTGDGACKDDVRCEGPECAVTCQDKGCAPDKVHCCATACTFNGQSITCR